jgi:hypothetical protein
MGCEAGCEAKLPMNIGAFFYFTFFTTFTREKDMRVDNGQSDQTARGNYKEV